MLCSTLESWGMAKSSQKSYIDKNMITDLNSEYIWPFLCD